MKKFDRIDTKLAELGFVKTINELGMITYKQDAPCGRYTHRIDISYKNGIGAAIQSYQEGTNSDGWNNCVCMDLETAKLIYKKAKQFEKHLVKKKLNI